MSPKPRKNKHRRRKNKRNHFAKNKVLRLTNNATVDKLRHRQYQRWES